MSTNTFTEPYSYSPSSLSQFTTCPLAFRFSYIDRIPQPPQIAATKGTVVHRALEHLFARSPEDRILENAIRDLDTALDEYSFLPDFVDLNLDEKQTENFISNCNELVKKYFQLENPQTINPIGLELKLEADIDGTVVRGIIDRLELDENGDLVVTDYKTGSVPKANNEQSKMTGMNIYALLCEKVFGQVPAKVQLLYLSAPTAIVATPTQSVLKGAKSKSNAIHKAVKSACASGDFRPRESILCNWCGYQELCPAKGGTLPQ